MKKIIIVLTFALLLPVLAQAQPSLQFVSESRDFGEVAQGTKVEHIFEFENAGTEDIRIMRLESS